MVTLALEADIRAIERPASSGRAGGGTAEGFRSLHLHHRVPGAPGQPQSILDWPDLAREGVGVITPNPKTSGAPAGISWRPGPMPRRPWGRGGSLPRLCGRHLPQRAGAGLRGPGLHHLLCGKNGQGMC